MRKNATKYLYCALLAKRVGWGGVGEIRRLPNLTEYRKSIAQIELPMLRYKAVLFRRSPIGLVRDLYPVFATYRYFIFNDHRAVTENRITYYHKESILTGMRRK